ncbi:MAG: DUF4422 domain-containing protein [Deltaproteobacteria bacterium]|nr:DUF4422 domain-containing protein [Deltaproteobacteria bacterium]
MRDIKIFVSHRIELYSETVNNPLYYNVRCGAVDDHRKNVAMPGDNTGNHISARRVSFGEFTVQYWAWKNIEADYYGLCHYRRYLSFAPVSFPVNYNNHVIEPFLDRFSIKRHWLLNESYMRELIEAHDIVVNQNTDIRLVTVRETPKKTVYAHWVDWDGHLIDRKVLEILIDLIEKMHPGYLQSAREYFAGWKFRACNCYILRRDLFLRLCEFQFDILFELEKRLDMSGYENDMKRMPSYMGEIMYGIFIHHLQKQGKYRVLELPLVFFKETRRSKFFLPSLARQCLFHLKKAALLFRDSTLPEGTKRRMAVKKLYHKFLNNN